METNEGYVLRPMILFAEHEVNTQMYRRLEPLFHVCWASPATAGIRKWSDSDMTQPKDAERLTSGQLGAVDNSHVSLEI